MDSLWIQDRINANHMEHDGKPLKNIQNVTIADMTPSAKEKDYVFQSLIAHYAYRLKERHPLLFKSMANSLKPNKPHQFQAEMDKRSKEFSGPLFTKSESRTEDIISMMEDIQKNIHTAVDIEGNETCYERKIIRDVVKIQFAQSIIKEN